MADISNIVKSLQNIMWKDPGVSGDAQRIEQLGWMITLKILDDKDAELELLDEEFVSVIPEEIRWRSWAADSEGITGDALKEFVDAKLFPTLQNLDVSDGNKRSILIRDIFAGTNNYMKNGTIIRQVVNKLNEMILMPVMTATLLVIFTKISCVIYKVPEIMVSFILPEPLQKL